MNIILLGAPGSGKGTQAEFIEKYLSVRSISTGNIIRSELKSGTKLGLEAKSYIEKGLLLPDEVVINMVKETVTKPEYENGFILDGFPRTIAQAEALGRLNVNIDKVIDIEVDDQSIINRLSGRRVCENCGASYHLENKKPEKTGTCDKCHSTLIQRKDDQVETIKERLKIYHEQTEPLKEYYKRAGKLVEIEGNKSVEETKSLVLKSLEE